MAAYWLLFATPFLGLFKPNGLKPRRDRIAWFCILATIVFAVGWRHRVGGDWGSYLAHFYRMADLKFIDMLSHSDPGYATVNWIVAQLGGNIYAVNLICAAIFTYGLSVFSARQPQPGLALLIAIPYLVIVVSMGYTRQSVAIGLMMIAFVKIGDRRIVGFVFFAILAALFHKSVLAVIPLAALAVTRGRIVTLSLTTAVVFAGYKFLLATDVDKITQVYFVNEYKAAQGGPVRVFMNALPAILFLIFRNRFHMSHESRRLWTILSLTAIAAVPAVFVLSTATDRLSLYLIPLQLLVFSRLQEIFGARNGAFTSLAVVFFYGTVQFVWLSFGANSSFWLPYQSALFSR